MLYIWHGARVRPPPADAARLCCCVPPALFRVRAQTPDAPAAAAALHLARPARDITKCGISCLDPGAFDFPGARRVTTVAIGQNALKSLPEALLWNMTSLRAFKAPYLANLATVPERFFEGQVSHEHSDQDHVVMNVGS